jgi:guanosine-3',5'-bis(diphosphate) 3'-pyrophosphohydrolase
MSTLEKAIEIAAAAHSGAVDKGGEPYILHPLRLMLSMKATDARIVAVLHDVVEDTKWTIDKIRQAGFSDTVLSAVEALTKRDGEEYEDFVLRARENPIAREVKKADVLDNMNLDRIPNPTEKDRRRVQKYENALALLDEKQ